MTYKLVISAQSASLHDLFWQNEQPPQSHSGFGWSYYSSLELCPRRHYLAHVVGLEHEPELGQPTEGSGGRTRGWLLHAMKEIYYNAAMSDAGIKDALAHIDRVKQEPKFANVATDAERVFLAWLENYCEEDRRNYTVRGVEQSVTYRPNVDDPEDFAYSCRYDTLLEDTGTPSSIHIFEHKHLRDMRGEMIAGYLNDGQIKGQMWLARRNRVWSKYAFPVVVVDITACTKNPTFYRQRVGFTDDDLRNFGTTMRKVHKLRHVYDAVGWPEFWAACRTPYPGAMVGLCEFFDLCQRGTRLSELRGAAPPGFVKKEK